MSAEPTVQSAMRYSVLLLSSAPVGRLSIQTPEGADQKAKKAWKSEAGGDRDIKAEDAEAPKPTKKREKDTKSDAKRGKV